jgi:hypothetical protein
MLEPLVRGRKQLAGASTTQVFFELQTTRGVADIVFAEVNESVAAMRDAEQLGTLQETSLAQVMHLFTQADTRSIMYTAREISTLTGLTPAHLRRSILPSLIESGWLRYNAAGHFSQAARYIPPINRVVAIEVKRSGWQRALSQAASHVDFADYTYVALDECGLPKNGSWERPFRHAGLGLVTIRDNEDGQLNSKVTKVIPPRRRRQFGAARIVVNERILTMWRSGSISGPISPVFGKMFSPSRGDDPRTSPWDLVQQL